MVVMTFIRGFGAWVSEATLSRSQLVTVFTLTKGSGAWISGVFCVSWTTVFGVALGDGGVDFFLAVPFSFSLFFGSGLDFEHPMLNSLGFPTEEICRTNDVSTSSYLRKNNTEQNDFSTSNYLQKKSIEQKQFIYFELPTEEIYRTKRFIYF